MPFDGIVTKAITEELQQELVNGRISKIYQPTQTELIFTIRNNRKNYQLLLSIHPSYARFHLTNEKFSNPLEPPMFCMVLRKHLQNALIESINQETLERIVTIQMRSIDEIGDMSTKYLVIEIMGRHSNVVLLNEKKEHIIDSLKHVSPLQNRYRTIMPGAKYIPPPAQNKLNPLIIDGEELIKKLDFNAGKLDQQIVRTVIGFSPVVAREIIARANLGSPEKYMEHFSSIKTLIQEQKYSPTIYIGEKEDFHVLPLTSLKGEKRCFSTVSEMLDQFYSGKAERDRVKQQSRDLQRFVKNELDKNVRKLNIHHKTIQRAKNADKYQRLGELLTAHLHLVKKGDASVTVIDYYDPEQQEISIPLQMNKTPSENAQNYFTRYRKLLHSKKVVQKEIVKTKQEINYLEHILHQIEHAREEDIEEIREELRDEGYLRKQRQNRRKKPKKPVPEQFISSDGTIIYVGRNNKQNEFVTHRLAHRNDIWLHTKDIPGSHVVIKSHEPSEETLLEAAQIAAYYSNAKHSSSVPVDYTEVRHVRKPTGGKPGFVIYDQQKTLYVTPEEKSIEKLKKN